MKILILCLGSGGVRGFTHIGVLKALEDNQINVGAYFGTSVGSLISVFSASGMSARQIEEKALSLKIFDLLDLTFPWNGYIKGQKLKKFVQSSIPQNNIEGLSKPVCIVATNAKTGEQINFRSGSIAERIQASSAIPGVFRPTLIDGVEYLDGDLKSPLPMRIAREQFKNDIILGVNIIARIDQAPRDQRNWSKTTTKNIYRRSLVESELSFCDIYLDLDIGTSNKLSVSWARHQIDVGYQQTLKIIPQLRQLLSAV